VEIGKKSWYAMEPLASTANCRMKAVAQILAQNAADHARMMPFCPNSADVND